MQRIQHTTEAITVFRFRGGQLCQSRFELGTLGRGNYRCMLSISQPHEQVQPCLKVLKPTQKSIDAIFLSIVELTGDLLACDRAMKNEV